MSKNLTPYFAMLDNEKIVPLGPHANFDSADDVARKLRAGVVWIFQESNLRALITSAEKALTTIKEAT